MVARNRLQGRKDEAEKSLKWLRGSEYDVSKELREIEDAYTVNKDKKITWGAFNTKAAKKSIGIATGLMIFQQFGGANAVVFNTTTIFQVRIIPVGSSLSIIEN